MVRNSTYLDRKKVGENYLVVYRPYNLNENTNPKKGENVELIDSQGDTIWRVNGMNDCKFWIKGSDSFCGISDGSGRIILNTHRGNDYSVDLDTGKVTYEGFSK